MTVLNIMSAQELLAKKYTVEQSIASELRTVARLLENGNYESAAWRLADASIDFVRYAKRKGKDIQGVDTPTGKGACLDKIMGNK